MEPFSAPWRALDCGDCGSAGARFQVDEDAKAVEDEGVAGKARRQRTTDKIYGFRYAHNPFHPATVHVPLFGMLLLPFRRHI